MNASEVSAIIGPSLLALFVCFPAPQDAVRIRTPLLYPDERLVDVFVLKTGDGYTVTDCGDALGWLGLWSTEQQPAPAETVLATDTGQALGVELAQGQLILRQVAPETLAESILRISQAVVCVADAGSRCAANQRRKQR